VQIQSGLREGDKVALNLSSQITSGMKVDAHDLNSGTREDKGS
jgi:hypothetical protein